MSDTLSKQLLQLLGALETVPRGRATSRFFVNRLPSLIDADEVVAWEEGNVPIAISDVQSVDPKVPHVQRLSLLYRKILSNSNTASAVSADTYQPEINELPAHAIWLPFIVRSGGVLILRSSKAFSGAEIAVAKLCVSALAPLSAEQPPRLLNRISRLIFKPSLLLGITVVVSTVALMSVIKVPDMSLVSAELASGSLSMVRAEVGGVIVSMEVDDGQAVNRGELLFTLDTDRINAQIKIARAESEQLLAEYEQVALASLENTQARSRMSVLRGELNQKFQQISFLEDRLTLHSIRAKDDGIVDLNAIDDYIGLPIDLGQPLATIVDPETIEVSLKMPVASSTNVKVGDRVTFFPYSMPWKTVGAAIKRISLTPDLDASGTPVYKLVAQLDPVDIPIANELGIGEAGKARIDSLPIPVGLYLTRRPLAWLRQVTGL